ncbi:hypothetical protein [Celeribacter sp.]|uniref:hypothetical protein n=1 Tax=Celeribacter sp. TaxID=1890673 RepID=UPI003A8FB0F4
MTSIDKLDVYVARQFNKIGSLFVRDIAVSLLMISTFAMPSSAMLLLFENEIGLLKFCLFMLPAFLGALVAASPSIFHRTGALTWLSKSIFALWFVCAGLYLIFGAVFAFVTLLGVTLHEMYTPYSITFLAHYAIIAIVLTSYATGVRSDE